MDGVINLNKPAGISSAKALYRVRKITGQRKSGHAGTLDPAATGVLLLCMGKATKLVEQLMNLPKVYVASARLDVTSESFDSDRPLIPVPAAHVPSHHGVEAALREFVGVIQQAPPAISAIKVGGRPSYRLERKGQIVEHKPRPVTIYDLKLLRYEWPQIDFEMTCGRGAYVRALIRDLGARLGCGGCLTSLARTRVGSFTLENSYTIEQIESAQNAESLVFSLHALAELIASPPGENSPEHEV
jgi:tRNA pseudouridine55 synthase